MPGFVFGAMNTKKLAMGIAVLLIFLAATYYFSSDSSIPKTSSSSVINAAFIPPTQVPRSTADANHVATNSYADATRLLGNPLERSLDLSATYQQFKDSKNPVERHIAYRAWSACFPTFIAPQGQSISIENLTKALPKGDPATALRVEAYRSLFGRCKHFSHMTRAESLSATQHQQEASNSGAILSPGDIASKHLTDGKPEQAMQVARDIISSQDAFAIASLSAFINQIGVAQVDGQSAHSDLRPDLHSLAFSIAACQMGLDCGAGSLTALQMCASMGQCYGSVLDRYLQSMPNQADRDAVQREAQQVLDAIRSKNFKALGL